MAKVLSCSPELRKQEIHDEEVLTLVDADFVDGDNIGMLETGSNNGLGAKAFDKLQAGLRPEQQHLQRDNAIQALLPRSIDDAHATV